MALPINYKELHLAHTLRQIASNMEICANQLESGKLEIESGEISMKFLADISESFISGVSVIDASDNYKDVIIESNLMLRKVK